MTTPVENRKNAFISLLLSWCFFHRVLESLTPFLYLPCCYFSHSVVSDTLSPCGLLPARILCPWNFPDKNTRLGCDFILQGLFLTQGSNLHVLCWQVHSLRLTSREAPVLSADPWRNKCFVLLPWYLCMGSQGVWLIGACWR